VPSLPFALPLASSSGSSGPASWLLDPRAMQTLVAGEAAAGARRNEGVEAAAELGKNLGPSAEKNCV
jgi:hypothetical protein